MSIEILLPTREFRCYECGVIERHGVSTEPQHCGRHMKPGLNHVQRNNAFRIDLVKLRPENPKWKQNDRWEDQWEVWLLWAGRAGRDGSEDSLYIGVIGKGMIGWEYEMAPGYTPSGGAGFSRDVLVGDMAMIATQGDM